MVFIIAMLMAVSVPNFVRLYRSSLLNSTARSFVTCCQYARLQAVLHQRKTELHINLEAKGQKFWITQATGKESGEEDWAALKWVDVPPQVKLVSVELADETILQQGQVDVTFYPNGTCDPITVSMRGQERGNGLAISVDAITGRATPYAVKL